MTDAPVSSPLWRKIIRNTLFNFMGRSWAMLVGLLLTPYIVSMLGMERFGVWSLVFVVTSYLGLLDLGAGTASVKYIAEYYTQRDHDAINSIVSTGFTFYLILAFVLIALGVAFDDFVLHLFRIPSEILDEARFVLLGGIAILSFSNAFSAFQAVTRGVQRMDVTNIIALAVSVPDVIGTIAFLQLGYGLRGLIVKEAIVFVLTAGLFIFYAFRLLPSLKIGFRFCQRQRLRELLGYGIKVQVSQLADLVSSQVDKVLLGYFLGVRPVALYELGSKVVFTSKRLSQVLISAVMPAASEIEARRDPHTLLLLYLRGSKYLVLVAAPLFFLITSAAPLIMRTWMGRGYELSALVIQLLALGHLVHVLTGVGTMIVKGIGKPEVEMRYTLLLLVMNIVLGVALVARLGFLGVLIATPFSLIASSLYFMVIVHRLLRISLVPFIRDTYLKPVLASLVASLPLFALSYLAKSFLLTDGRLSGVVVLGSGALLFAGVYLVILLRSGYLDSYDKGILVRISESIHKA